MQGVHSGGCAGKPIAAKLPAPKWWLVCPWWLVVGGWCWLRQHVHLLSTFGGDVRQAFPLDKAYLYWLACSEPFVHEVFPGLPFLFMN